MTQKLLTYTEVLMGSTLSTPKHICWVTAAPPPPPPPGHFNIGLQGDIDILVINNTGGRRGLKGTTNNFLWKKCPN